MEKNETTQQAFVFHPSFWNALKELDDNSLKNEIAFAIISYGNEGEVELAELSPVARFAMRLIMPIIDKQQETYRRKRDAGKSGGRPKNENQKGENEKPIQNQTPDFEKANQNQNCNPEKASQNQTESTNNFRLGKEKDIIYNKDINIKKEKEIEKDMCVKGNAENQNSANETHTQIFNSFFSLVKDYYPAEEKSQQYAKQLADDFINYNKDKPDTFWRDRFWERYIVRFLENDDTNKRESSAKEKGKKRFSYQEYCAAITPPTKKYDKEDFETITDNEGKTWWVLKQ